jgi:hypothetical protein
VLTEHGGCATDFLPDLPHVLSDTSAGISDSGRFLASMPSIAVSHKFLQEGLFFDLELFHAT